MTEPIAPAPSCAACHLTIAPYAPQVRAATGVYHKDCYEGWFTRWKGARPKLTPVSARQSHLFQAVEP